MHSLSASIGSRLLQVFHSDSFPYCSFGRISHSFTALSWSSRGILCAMENAVSQASQGFRTALRANRSFGFLPSCWHQRRPRDEAVVFSLINGSPYFRYKATMRHLALFQNTRRPPVGRLVPCRIFLEKFILTTFL